MASLQELLTREGFEGSNFPTTRKSLRSKGRSRAAPDDSVTLPIYICHDKKIIDSSKKKAEKPLIRNGSSVYSSKRVGSVSETLLCKSMEEPAIDEIAIRAVVSILSGYVGRYSKDESFREIMRKKCNPCLIRKGEMESGICSNLEMGMKSVDRLVEEGQGNERELRMKASRNSIGLLNMVITSLNSAKKSTKNGAQSHLSSCAQLYLAIVYKIEKNEKVSAKHLLQVFCDSPFFARTHLLPELWEHFFLPHLLHLKVWYNQELEFVSNFECEHKDRKIKALSKVYNEHMDRGTVQFALYYIQWLKDGARAPPVPVVPSPSKSIHKASRRSSDSYFLQSSSNKNLYHAVFGPSLDQQLAELRSGNVVAAKARSSNEKEILYSNKNYENIASDEHNNRRMPSILDYRGHNTDSWRETVKSDYFRFFTCQNITKEYLESSNVITKNSVVRVEGRNHLLSNDFSKAITAICSSDVLSECEIAIRVVTKAWLDAHDDTTIEVALSKPPVVEGMLEVLLASDDDEILELVISVLAELAARSEVIRQIILNSDPQLQVFLKLLKSSSLFLKASILLYLSKPQAKQMISVEWLPLVLRVLEFGGQLQTLFSIRCKPHEAAFYLLDQLLKGFDEDRNLENCRHLISLGGLSLLLRRLERGEIEERKNSVSIISCCIQADGSCRNYLAENLNKASLLELIVHESNKNSDRCGLALLVDLLCLSRRTRITNLLDGLKEGWSGLGIMNILSVYLQRALPEEQPLVATILLQLDFMEDSLNCSIFREEAIVTIITALNSRICREKGQDNLARALLILGGRFSCTGEPSTENWLLKLAGFKENSGDSSHSQPLYDDVVQLYEEEEDVVNWQLKAATVLFNHGHKSLLSALSTLMTSCILSLAKASLITVSWMSRYLFVIKDEKLCLMAPSILVPPLIKYLNHDKDVEDQVLASYSLLNLSKYTECKHIFRLFDEDTLDYLQNLSLVTWTAEELTLILKSRSMHPYTEHENSHIQRSTRK
ncbi:putative E3 ubiquitin-protein ligase LIN-1 isoform X2 [Benincasa hispida]|uniref:putative E3 ubiquitin-protein ligase LIN-1 isoform X2 n=1 Tax=Benincasa hispida TaxID=102211 RepID=UPI00190029E6|nr:putative E3 ubiquitin-protein ligase LIN-1 isoform X2 [Benincasa hispida]